MEYTIRDSPFWGRVINAPLCIKVPHKEILQLAVKASDGESSRCDHVNGNQYAYL